MFELLQQDEAESSTQSLPPSVPRECTDAKSTAGREEHRRLLLGTLIFPGDFDRLPDIAKELISRANTVELRFQTGLWSAPRKLGLVKASFASSEDAMQCYEVLVDMIASSERKWNLKWASDEQFPEKSVTESLLDANDEIPDGARILVRGLLSTVDEDTLLDIFGRSTVINVTVNTEHGQSMAVVTFKSKMLADEATLLYEGYEVTDGIAKSHLQMESYPPVETTTTLAKPEQADTSQATSNGTLITDHSELSAVQLHLFLKNLMTQERINWAELSTEQDLWGLLNKVIKEVGWQPEETLKDAMMLSLRMAVEEMSDYDWMTDHLNSLVRRWSKVVDNPERSKVRKRLQLMNTVDQSQAPGADYVPPPPERPRRRRNRNQGLMGIGGLLSAIKFEASQGGKSSHPSSANIKNGPKAKIRRKQRMSSSESGEASTTTESEQEEEEREYKRDTKASRKSASSCEPIDTNEHSAEQVEPQLVQQVVSSILRMMPTIREWKESAMAPKSRLQEHPFMATEVPTNINFTVPPPPPPPVPRIPYGFTPVPGASATVPPSFPVMLSSVRVPPLQISQPATFAATAAVTPFYCMPPQNRQY